MSRIIDDCLKISLRQTRTTGSVAPHWGRLRSSTPAKGRACQERRPLFPTVQTPLPGQCWPWWLVQHRVRWTWAV